MDNQKQKEMFYLLNEILYGMKFHDSIKGSFVPDDLSFSFGGGAIDYAGAYVLFRVLNDFKPKSILELGLGQSTKIITCYLNIHSEVGHILIEHDREWIDFYKINNEISPKTQMIVKDIELREIKIKNNISNTYIYSDFTNKLSDKKFDLMLIDAPFGWNEPYYSRIDCLDLVPASLSKSFVIMIHDVMRSGEKRTFELMKEKLTGCGMDIGSRIYQNLGLIVSKNNKFLCTL